MSFIVKTPNNCVNKVVKLKIWCNNNTFVAFILNVKFEKKSKQIKQDTRVLFNVHFVHFGK